VSAVCVILDTILSAVMVVLLSCYYLVQSLVTECDGPCETTVQIISTLLKNTAINESYTDFTND